MLRNRLIIKKIRNICILLMAIIIMIGVYTNIRRSRAENVIQIALEISDKSEALEMQTIMVDATETQDGNYLLDLPTSVNGNIVTKYYTSDGTEVLMNDENADKTLTLTEAEVSEPKIQLQTDYDKKEVTTEDGQTITLYNKELMDVKEPEENAEEGTNDTDTNNTETNETLEEGTTEETNLDDSVIVTGYMPLEAQVDINEIDLATLSDIQLPSDTQTMQKAYEVSVYQTFRTTIDADGNAIAEEIEMPQSQMDNGTNNETEENTTNSTTDNIAIENITSENARDNENVQSITEGTTPDNTTITTITLNDGTTIEEEKIEYDPSIYNEELTIKTKNTEANTTATVYGIQEDNQIQTLENTTEEEYVDTIIPKDNQTVKYILATEPISDSNNVESNSEVSTMALTDGNMLMSTANETNFADAFLGNTSLRRSYIENITFLSSIAEANSTAWDVSAEQNGSIMAWYETFPHSGGGDTYRVYIGSNETIYANTDSSYLFSNIANYIYCNTTEIITNIELLNTSQVTNMLRMFSSCGMVKGEGLDLGSNFDTSNVTNMYAMFDNAGNANSSFTYIDLGDKFDTSNVTDMDRMFCTTGEKAMTSLDLGSAFTKIADNHTDMFTNTGKSGEIVITVSGQIYQDEHHVTLNENSNETIEFTRGTFKAIRSNYLRTTNTETQSTSGFLGNTSIRRQNIDNVTFVSSTSGMNSTAWDVSEAQDGSIMAWYTTNSNGTYKVYIGSDETIYANPDSSYLFSYIGDASNCTVTETITNLDLLDTSKVTDMSHMFHNTGVESMTSLDLGDNFDTSNVTDMSYMFNQTGYNAMTSLDLGDNFDTSNVTNMSHMFNRTGYKVMTSLDLGNNFDTRNVTDMSSMFLRTGYEAMTSLNLGDKFDTSSVTDMSSMFAGVGHDSMTSLDLGDKFDTSNVTNMGLIFTDVLADIGDYSAIKTLDLGPAFTHIIEASGISNFRDLSNTTVIYVPESIYQDRTHFKENANSTTISSVSGTINPKYRTEWVKQSVQVNTSSKNVQISLRGTTNTEVSGSEYASNVTSSLTASNIKIFMDDTEVTSYITKSLGSATRTYNSSTGAYDVLHTLTLSNFEEAYIRTGKDYKEWSGNIRIEIPQGTLTDTYGNKNMELASDGSRDDHNIEDATTDRNTTNTLFADVIKPDFIYNYSSTDIDHDAKTLTVDFSVTDKYFNSSTISSNAANITVKMLDTNVVPENLTKSLRKVQDITETRNGSSVKVGEKYRLVISGFEKASIDNGKYKEYSGPVSIVFPAGMATDKSGNSSVQTNITVGISEPNHDGNQQIVDFITPDIEKIDSSIDVKNRTAKLTFQVTDKYLSSNTLTSGNLQILVNGSVNTSITKQLESSDLYEQRVTNGTTSNVRYGTEYTLTLSGLDTTVNQIKVRIPAGMITDTSGNANPTTDFILFNTLRNTSTEQNQDNPFLGNANIQRQMIENVTFVDNIPEDVYDVSNNTFKDSTAWDVSAQGDNSIIAWYDTNANETYKVYIGSNDEIFGNVDSSYLFNDIALSRYCTATEVITNIDLLNTSNVTNMRNMFENTGYNAMTSLDLGDNFDTSSVTNMIGMFAYTGRNAMTSLDLGDKFDTSNVTEMVQMFFQTGYTAMTSLNLGEKFDTSNVTNMDSMFRETGHDKMTSLNLGENFDTSNVTNMSEMFNSTGAYAMTSLDLGDKFDTSNVNNMYWMFNMTGSQKMTNLNLGDKFDTSNVTNMSFMFYGTGLEAMTSLDLGDKFDTSNVTDMSYMFCLTGNIAMTNLDLGPAFTNIASTNTNMFSDTGKSGCVINAPEAIYQNSTSFKLNTNSSTTINFTNGTINPKYRTEWIKETVQTDTTQANNPKLNITLRGTTNTEVAADEYISDVTSSLTADNIKIFIDDTEVTDIITKKVGTATQTNNTRTGAKDVLQVITLSNFEEATRQTGKLYTEWSGNIRIEVAQGTLSDTTGPADETGKKITYGNKNMEVAEDGTRIDNKIEDETKVDHNIDGTMFVDYIKPEFTYEYSSTDIDHDAKTLTVEFSVTDKYFNNFAIASDASNITVKMLDTNAVPENITKTLTKVGDITETRDGSSVKIGETYRLVISGLEQASIAEDGKYKEYSGPMSIVFPEGIASDKSGNTNNQKNITVGINEPDQTGDAEIVDVVDPVWEARNLNIDREKSKVTVDLYGTDKYYEDSTLDVSKIKVIIDGEEITSATNVVKELSAATPLTEMRDGANVQYGVKYTLTLRDWLETDSQFEASGRIYREYSGETEIQIQLGTLVDESGNENQQTTLDLGKIDFIRPEIKKVSSSKDDENKTETIVFDVVDKDLATVAISTTDTSRIHVYVDNEEATGVTKTITNVEDLTAVINGSNRVVGKRYTLVLSNFEQPRTTIDYDREYSDWSGEASIKIDARVAIDNSGNYNTESLTGDTNNDNLEQGQKLDKKILLFGVPSYRGEGNLNQLQSKLQEKYTTVDIITSERGSENIEPIINEKIMNQTGYDLIICDAFAWDTGDIAKQDTLNYNLITISNDASTTDNNLIEEAVINEDVRIETITPQPGVLQDIEISVEDEWDSQLYKVKFKDGVKVLANATYTGDPDPHDVIGYTTVGDYKQIHSQLLLASNYVEVVSRLADFVFDNVDTSIEGDFVDFIKPNATYQHSETDIDYDGKTYTMVFDMTDKFYTSGTLTLNDLAIRIDGEEPDWTKVTKSLQEEDITNTVNGENKVIGKRYTLTLSNLQQLQVKEGDNYLDYSGVVTVAIPANKILDTTGNGNNATTITSGINLPGGEAGDEEVVDVVNPTIEKMNSSVNIVKDGTAEVTFKVTDKYFANSTLTNENIQVLVNGSVNTNITKQLTSTPLTEQRMVNGVATDVQYGAEYTLKLTGLDTTVNQIKVRVPEGTITDTSGNGNEDVEFMLYNVLKESSAESAETSPFLGNMNIQRQIVDNVTFVDNIPEDVYDVSTNTFTDSTAWDVSAEQDKSILAWYEPSANSTVKVYIGSNDEIFGNVDSTNLFTYIGYSENCTATETITNIGLLNVSNVSNMTRMFRYTGYTAMTSLDLGDKFDTSNATEMYAMFSHTGYTSMVDFNLGNKFDTSNVRTMFAMFYYTGYMQMSSLNLKTSFNTKSVLNMSYMFFGTGYTSMTTLDLGDSFDTSNVQIMDNMFYETGYMAMTSLDLGDKFNTINVTNMSNMFFKTGYIAMTSLDLGENFDTSNVTDMSNMFYYTGYTSMINLNLGNKFDTSSVTNMRYMFDSTGYTAMTSLDLKDKFDTSNVTDMYGMFYSTGYTAMTSLDLGDKFDTSNVTNMYCMFWGTGYMKMTNLDLGDKFDTSNVTNMNAMFKNMGYMEVTSLDLGDKFNTSNVTDMEEMFHNTGYTSMTSLDLGPAFTKIASGTVVGEDGTYGASDDFVTDCGVTGATIYAPEAIYNDSKNFKIASDSTTIINYERGTINPKYRTEWIKETVQTDETEVNNPKLNITLRGTTNTEVPADEYISDVTSTLTADNIKVFIDDTEITDIVTKTIGTATQTNNTRTGAKDVLQTITLSNFEEATRQAGKQYKEWSGNVRIEIAQGTLSDTTGPADETGKEIPYGNKNMGVAEDGTRTDNKIEDEEKLEQNTEGAMFVDFIEPEFTYEYSSTDINYDQKTLTVEFSITDKYFNSLTIATDASNITVKMLDTNAVPENITKTITKVEDIEETRNGQEVKIGEKYRLVISGLEQASIAEDGKYKEYSGPMSIVFPAGIASDKSENTNNAKNITIGINEPDQTGDAEIVDVVDPIWEVRNLNIDKQKNQITVDLYGTDKYYENNTLDVSKIKVIIDGEEITSTTNVLKQLSAATPLTETRDGASVQYGVKYTLTLSNWIETDSQFEASGRIYREYSGETEIQIQAGTLVDESGNENLETTLDLGKIDVINPEIIKVSSTVDNENKTETIVFDVVDKDLATVNISTTDTSTIHVYVDNEEAIGVTKTITNIEDLTTMVNGTSKVVGKRYTLVLSNFEQPRTTINYDREFSDWSGDVMLVIESGTAIDGSGNPSTDQQY